jgi:hypothetical protein
LRLPLCAILANIMYLLKEAEEFVKPLKLLLFQRRIPDCGQSNVYSYHSTPVPLKPCLGGTPDDNFIGMLLMRIEAHEIA